jgi:hypothetical protein
MRQYRVERRSVWTALAASLLTLGGGTPIALWIAQRTAPTAGIAVWPNGWTAGAAACTVIALYIFGALLFEWPLPGAAAERALAAATRRGAEAGGRDRRRRILTELRAQYRAEYITAKGDGIPHDVMMGTMRVPTEWINARLAAMGEDWTI